MKKGYTTDANGNVTGYFELPSVPANTDSVIWVESDEKPKLYVSPEQVKKAELAEARLHLAKSDYKILKKLEKLLPADDVDVIERQGKRDRINQLEAAQG